MKKLIVFALPLFVFLTMATPALAQTSDLNARILAVLNLIAHRQATSPLVISNFHLVAPGPAPTIDSLTGPTSLKVVENGQWTIEASDPSQSPLIYSVKWGDSALTESTKTPIYLTDVPKQVIVFNHTYQQAGTYLITASAVDNVGQISKKTVNLEVK